MEDIDPRQISIRQIGQRYIDRSGNKFTTRFNMKNREIEIVRLASSLHEAMKLRAQILKEKLSQYDSMELPESSEHQYVPPEPVIHHPVEPRKEYPDETINIPELPFFEETKTEEHTITSGNNRETRHPLSDRVVKKPAESVSEYDPYYDDFSFIAPDDLGPTVSMGQQVGESFYELQFIEETAKEMEKIDERLFAIINSIKKTSIYESHQSDDLFHSIRRLDSEGRSALSESINLYKEISQYHRHISYYMAKMSSERKAILDGLKEDRDKLEKIKRWELQDSYRSTYTAIMEIAQDTLKTIDTVLNSQSPEISAAQKTMISNAKTSCEVLVEDCTKALNTIGYWIKTHN